MSKSVPFSAVAAVGLMAASVEAAQIQITTTGVAAYNNSSSFTPVAFNPTLDPATKGVLYEIPINFKLTGLAAGQSFGNLAVNVSWDGAIAPDPAAGPYAANSAT